MHMLPGGGEGREEVRKHSQGWAEVKVEAKGGTGKAGVERGEAVVGSWLFRYRGQRW